MQINSTFKLKKIERTDIVWKFWEITYTYAFLTNIVTLSHDIILKRAHM